MHESREGARVLPIRWDVPTPLPPGPQRALSFALLISATRCIVQYVLLPFVLPWLGFLSKVPVWATLVLSAVALASLGRNLRTMWRLRHARRWSYLAIAVVVGAALVLFIAVDLRSVIHIGL